MAWRWATPTRRSAQMASFDLAGASMSAAVTAHATGIDTVPGTRVIDPTSVRAVGRMGTAEHWQ